MQPNDKRGALASGRKRASATTSPLARSTVAVLKRASPSQPCWSSHQQATGLLSQTAPSSARNNSQVAPKSAALRETKRASLMRKESMAFWVGARRVMENNPAGGKQGDGRRKGVFLSWG